MAKTCKNCGTSLGFLAKLKGTKASENDAEVCSNCAAKMPSDQGSADQGTEQPTEEQSS